MPTLIESFEAERQLLQLCYDLELRTIADDAAAALRNCSHAPYVYSTHVPFNLSAKCQNLAGIAAKIEFCQMTLRSLKEAQ